MMIDTARRAEPLRDRAMKRSLTSIRHHRSTPFTSSNSEVSVYTLMKLLGHESMATSQRYVAGAARETRTAAAQNPLYGVIRRRLHQPERLDGHSHQ
jgi:integrase/recombinase XerC